jgi:general secretion pathway protein G
MKRTTRNERRGQAGFTLVEIMVVVIIIGLLIGVGGVAVKGKVTKARIVKAKADIAMLSGALQLFEAEYGFFPSTEEGLTALVSTAAESGLGVDYFLPNGTVPTDPWRRDYVYVGPEASEQGMFVITSQGPRELDSSDDISNISSSAALGE